MKDKIKKYKVIIIIAIFIIAIITTIIFSLFSKQEVDVNQSVNNEIIQQFMMEGDIIGWIKSEVIDLQAPIKHGIDYGLLENYVGHFPDTAILSGNIGLAAHNRGHTQNWFERLYELEIGDKLTYITKFDTMYFEVSEIKQVHEREVHVLYSTVDTRLTLVTCIPNNRRYRLIVIATEIIKGDFEG